MYQLICSLILVLSMNANFFGMETYETKKEARKEKKLLTIVDAAAMDNLELFTKLFNGNSDINQKDKYGRTALHYVAINGSEKMFHKLITYPNLNVNIQDNEGVTPIRAAVSECILPAVLALLQVGADPNIKDNHGISAVDEAKQSGYAGMLFLFEVFKK